MIGFSRSARRASGPWRRLPLIVILTHIAQAMADCATPTQTIGPRGAAQGLGAAAIALLFAEAELATEQKFDVLDVPRRQAIANGRTNPVVMTERSITHLQS